MRTKKLIDFRKIIYRQKNTECIKTAWQNVDFINVTGNGTCIYHLDYKVRNVGFLPKVSFFLVVSTLVCHLGFLLFSLLFLVQVLLSFESNGNLKPVFLLVNLSFGLTLYVLTCFIIYVDVPENFPRNVLILKGKTMLKL